MAMKRVLGRAALPQTAYAVESNVVGKLPGHGLGVKVWFEAQSNAGPGASSSPKEHFKSRQGNPLPGFTGKVGETFYESSESSLYVGLGKTGSITDYRLAVHNAVKKAKGMKVPVVMLNLPECEVQTTTDLFAPTATALEPHEVVEKTACFAVTAMYDYNRLKVGAKAPEIEKTDSPAPEPAAKTRKATVGKKRGRKPSQPPPKPAAAKRRGRVSAEAEATQEVSAEEAVCTSATLDLVVASDNKTALQSGAVIGDCVNVARNLGNLREDEGIPEFYAEWALKELTKLGVKARHVLKGPQLEKAGLNLMYGVGKGSIHAPHLVVLEYNGTARSSSSTALVGKGVTFDCGGLNVKPYGSMETMHMDMMGAATVLATLRAVATLELPINVVGVVGLAENAIGPNSLHPSNILTSLKGTTVEILNTDAEGRLVLADALTFVQQHAKLKVVPDTIIDLATLTGAITVGLGSKRAGLFGNDSALSMKLMQSGRNTTEELWPMPIAPEHTEALKGGIADLKNVSAGREAGSCTAAAFLNHFIEPGRAWAHLDIAGTGMGGDKPSGYNPAGAPGYGVQLLVDYLRR